MSDTTRRRRRRQGRPGARSGPADAIFDIFTRPVTIGVLCAVAGAGLMVAPWLRQPQHLSATWWTDAFRDPELMQVIIALLVVAMVLSVGLGWRVVTGHRTPLGEDESGDVEVHPEEGRAVLERGHPVLYASVVSLVLGLVMVVASWATLLRDVPPTEGVFPLNQAVEAIASSVRGKPLKVMLPRRVTVSSLATPEDKTSPWGVTVSFTKPKQEEIAEHQLALGESIEVVDRRFTFVGVRTDFSRPRAIVSSDAENTIPARGQKGDTLKLSLDGPTYTIKEMVPDHLGMMGPAVQLEDSKGKMFWLYQRQPKKGRAFSHGLKLDYMESAPAAVFSIAPVVPFWPLVAGGLLFTLGLGGMFSISDVRRRRRSRRHALFSLNDAGTLAEQYAPHGASQDEAPAFVMSRSQEEE